VVYDLNVNEVEPHAVLTGDTLFIGDVAAGSAGGARLVGNGTRQHVVRFAAQKAAGASRCQFDLSGSRRGFAVRQGDQQRDCSTLGNSVGELRLQPMSKEVFIQVVTAITGCPGVFQTMTRC